MKRELTIERRGDHYHLKFHNYMGPWEGHQIEHVLDLNEIPTPTDAEHDAQVLGPNQSYLWNVMSYEPELHALITADRLERLAILVRDRDVEVLEGKELLPTPPPTAHVAFETKNDTDEGSYVALIEKRHESVWERGPKAVIGAFLIRAIPAALIVFAIVVWSRHLGDKHSAVSVDEMFARAGAPRVEQGFVAGVLEPDYSNLVRNEIRTVSYAYGERMLLGDGNLVVFEGAKDVMPWLTQASAMRAALVLDADAADGVVAVTEVRCGSSVLARDLVLRRVVKLPPSDSAPMRGNREQEGQFLERASLPVDEGQDAALLDLVGKPIALRGKLVRDGDRVVLRASEGGGVVLDTTNPHPKLRQFLDVFVDDPVTVVVDLRLTENFPWTRRDDPLRQRQGTGLAGIARVASASAQNYHVNARG